MTDVVWIVSSCALILAVIIIRAIFSKRMSAGFRYALWGLVLLRLLIPGTVFSSPVSIEAAAKSTEVVQNIEAVKDYSSIARTETGAVIGRPRVPSSPRKPAESPQTAEQTTPETRVILNEAAPERFVRMQKTLEARDILNIVWYTGMGLSALYFIAANLRFYFKLRAKRERLNVDIGCPVYTVEGLTSSCLFLNSIYVSKETAEDDDSLRFVLAHERAHRRHGDGLFALLRSAALVLHWYDPLVWLAAFLSRRDSELFADAGAIAALGDEERENYGRTLIALSSGAKVYAPIACSATMMTSGKRTLKARVKGIANRRRMGVLIAAAVLILAAAACLCTFCGAEKTDEANANSGDPFPMYEGEPPTASPIIATMQYGIPATPYICDLDFDGRDDTVTLETIGKGEELPGAAQRVIVTLGSAPDEPFVFEQPNAVMSALHVLDCDTQDDRLDLLFNYVTEDSVKNLWMLRVSRDGSRVEQYVPRTPLYVMPEHMFGFAVDDGFDAENGIPVVIVDENDPTKLLFTRVTLTYEGFKLLIPLQDEIVYGNENDHPIKNYGVVDIVFYNEPAPEGEVFDPNENPVTRNEYVNRQLPSAESDWLREEVNSIEEWENDAAVNREPFTFDGQFRVLNNDGVYYFNYSGLIFRRCPDGDFFGNLSREDAEFLMSLSVDGSDTVFPEEYDEHDMTALASYFNEKDEDGVRNGDKLFKNYDPADPVSWQSGNPLTAPEMIWNDEGKLVSIGLWGGIDSSSVDTLAGRLELTGFTELMSVSLSGEVQFDELTITDCPKLRYIYNEWPASGTVDVRTDNAFDDVRLGSFTQLLFSGRIEEGGEVKRLNLIPEDHGHVEVMLSKHLLLGAEGEQLQLMMYAFPDGRYRFAGWFDEAAELYSAESAVVLTEAEPPLGDEFVLQAVFTRAKNTMEMYEGEPPVSSGIITEIPDLPPYTPYICDLDFDGKEDTVRLERIPADDPEACEGRRITVTLGSAPGTPYEFSVSEVTSSSLYVLDCDTQDDRLDLFFSYRTVEGFMEFFAIRVRDDGTIGNEIFPHTASQILTDSGPDDPTGAFDAKNGVPVLVSTPVMGSNYLPTRITLTGEGFKMLEPMSYGELSDSNPWRELKRDLSVTRCDPGHDAEEILCPEGTKLLPYRTDGWYLIEFKLESGATVRKDIDVRGSTVLIDGLDQSKFFDIDKAE